MKIFNKLVRDKIPQIIESNGEKCKIRVLCDEEYLQELNKKIKEEVNKSLTDYFSDMVSSVKSFFRGIFSK